MYEWREKTKSKNGKRKPDEDSSKTDKSKLRKLVASVMKEQKKEEKAAEVHSAEVGSLKELFTEFQSSNGKAKKSSVSSTNATDNDPTRNMAIRLQGILKRRHNGKSKKSNDDGDSDDEE